MGRNLSLAHRLVPWVGLSHVWLGSKSGQASESLVRLFAKLMGCREATRAVEGLSQESYLEC